MAGVRKHPLNLPGVDTSQPDIFETPDLPAHDAEETPNVADKDNENIDRAGVVAKKAFEKFSDKSFATTDKDYSEAIGKRKGRGGLISGQSEFSIREDEKTDKEPETPLQKFHRLQFEISEFIKEVQSTTDQPQKGKEGESANPAELAQQLVVLQGQLMGLMASDQTRAVLDPAHFLKHHSLLQTDLSKKLVSEIQAVTTTETKEGGKEKDTKGGEGKVTYELYYTPDQHKYAQLNRLVDLEKRVEQVETLVGPAPVAGSGTAPPTSAPLASLVGELRDKVALLDGPRLETLLQKMKALAPQLETAAKGSDRTSVQDKKINDVFDMMNRWDAVATQLPALVSRLVALRALHEDGARFATQLATLDREQQAITALLRDNSELLGTLNSSFKDNMATITANVKQLDDRFSALQQRMEKK